MCSDRLKAVVDMKLLAWHRQMRPNFKHCQEVLPTCHVAAIPTVSQPFISVLIKTSNPLCLPQQPIPEKEYLWGAFTSFTADIVPLPKTICYNTIF